MRDPLSNRLGSVKDSGDGGPGPQDGDWIRTREATALLGRSHRTLWRLARAGHIRMHRPGNAVARFYRPDVEALRPSAG